MSDQDERDRAGAEDQSDPQIERLLQLVDEGPRIPPEGAARLKTALRPIWQATLQARRARRRKLALAGGSLAAAAAVVALMLNLPGEPVLTVPPVGTIERVEGSGAMLSAPDQSPAGIPASSHGLEIAPFHRIETDDATRVAVRLSSGASLRLDRGTSLLLESADTLLLLRGGAYLDTGRTGASVRIRTPLGTARDIGTRFEVRLAPGAMTVRVRDGLVAVDSGTRTRVRGGMQGVFGLGRAALLSPIAPDASEWDWTQNIAPTFTLEGRTAAEFLTWVERETGRRISYASAAAQRRAAESVLHGDLEGIPPAAAPEIVLPSAGLTAERASDGGLHIGLAGPDPEATP